MISPALLNALVDIMEEISIIEEKKSMIQDRIVRKQEIIAEDILSCDDEIVSKTVSRATAEIEGRYFNSTSNSNAGDVKPKNTFGSISTIVSDEEYFSAESNSDLAKMYNETYLFQQPIPRPRSQAIQEIKQVKDMGSLMNLLEGEFIENFHEKSILKKTKKFLKRSFSKSLRYLTL